MVLILECMIICFILLVPCVVAIANGIHNAAFLFERDVQGRTAHYGRIRHMGGLRHQWSERI